MGKATIGLLLLLSGCAVSKLTAADFAAAQKAAIAAEPTDPSASTRAACWGAWASYFAAMAAVNGGGAVLAAELAIEGAGIRNTPQCQAALGQAASLALGKFGL